MGYWGKLYIYRGPLVGAPRTDEMTRLHLLPSSPRRSQVHGPDTPFSEPGSLMLNGSLGVRYPRGAGDAKS